MSRLISIMEVECIVARIDPYIHFLKSPNLKAVLFASGVSLRAKSFGVGTKLIFSIPRRWRFVAGGRFQRVRIVIVKTLASAVFHIHASIGRAQSATSPPKPNPIFHHHPSHDSQGRLRSPHEYGSKTPWPHTLPARRNRNQDQGPCQK